jgi:hypothetical protein
LYAHDPAHLQFIDIRGDFFAMRFQGEVARVAGSRRPLPDVDHDLGLGGVGGDRS